MRMIVLPVFCFLLHLEAQNNYIKGKVVDKQTGKPIENVNVFLGYTLIGTTTNSNGEFLLNNIPPANYQLVVSHIQYEKVQEKISISENTRLFLDYTLEPGIYQLPDVVIRDENDDWYDYFEIFQDELLGWTDYAYECEILNPDNITFFDVGWDEFQAYCKEPIYIQNNALGYMITYIMDYFYTDGFTTKYTGIPYFQELIAPSDSVKKYWETNRHKAYCGSLRDFITQTSEAFINNNWQSDSSSFHLTYKPFFSVKEMGYIENLSSIMCQGDDSLTIKYIFNTPLVVYYYYQYDDSTYFSDRSEIELTQDTVIADINGRTFDVFGFHILSGYWTELRLGDSLPMEYFPPED